MLTDGVTTGRLLAGVWLVAETRDTPYDGSVETPNPLRERTSIRVLLLTADIRLTDVLGVQVSATIPDVTRSATVTRPDGDREFSETFRGPGDTSVVGWYRIPGRWNITLNAGLSLPTGKTEPPKFQSGLDDESLVPVSRLQRGSGTFDPMIGLSANRVVAALFPPGTRVFASAAARLPIAENEHGLRTGASWEIGAGASRELFSHSIIVIGRLSWLHRKQDVFNDVPVLVGGGDWLSLAPGVAIGIGKSTLQASSRFRSAAGSRTANSTRAGSGRPASSAVSSPVDPRCRPRLPSRRPVIRGRDTPP